MFSTVPSKPSTGPSLIVGMSQSSSDESNGQNSQPAAPAQEESQPQTTEYPQDTNYMEYLTCINNNRNPYIDRSGLNFPQSPDSSSGSSGNFPENESHPDEEPTQVFGSTQPVSEEVPTQPSTQITNQAVEEPTQTGAPSDVVPPSVNSVRHLIYMSLAHSFDVRSSTKPLPHPQLLLQRRVVVCSIK
jgi:hypothetical protein